MNGSIVGPLLAAATVLGCGDVVNPRPPSMPELSALAAGGEYTCGIAGAGAAYCWGNNSLGQLGDGSSANSSTPVAVSGGLSLGALTAGSTHVCGLTGTGAAYCWGNDSVGQLGDGSNTNSPAPVAVSTSLRFSALAAGTDHTCGLATDAAAYCWGDNAFGQLGDTSTTRSSQPVAVTGGLTFIALIAGRHHTCGLTTSGTGYCWGDNAFGQLGDSSTTNSSRPVAIAAGLTFGTLVAGLRHTCGLTAVGAAYCWGFNRFGQLGSSVSPFLRTIPTAVTGSLTFSELVAGAVHTCGLTTEGPAYCWGWNYSGQLGIAGGTGDLAGIGSPVAVSGGLRLRAITAGGGHTCGLLNDGTAVCWGNNSSGQLGDGSNTNSWEPVPVVWK